MFLDVLSSMSTAIVSKTIASFTQLEKDFNKSNKSDMTMSKKPRQAVSNMQNYKKQSPQKNLQEKKKILLKQLTTIEGQIRKRSIQKSRIDKKTENSVIEDSEAFDRASELIARMNKQRRQKTEAHRKWSENVQMKVQRSLKKFQEMKEEEEREKEQKRHVIEQRIEDRKKKLLMRKQYNKKADNLISQLQNYRISLPIVDLGSNPEEGANKLTSSLKRYPKSPFFQKVQQEDLRKKREEYLKDYEKKKIRERQQLYGRKVRRNLKDSSVFVTD